jgi:HEAT repeat protein
MKTKSILLTAIIFLISLSFLSAKSSLSEIQKQKAEINYLEGLKSDNEGLRGSSAYFLGEINSSDAIIPLMHVLRNDESECVRTMAALSLIKLNDARGIHLVKNEIKFNDFEKVREICQKFYSGYLKEKNSEDLKFEVERFASVIE